MPPADPLPREQNGVATPPPAILVINDDPLILDLLSNWLSAAGFRVLTANDGDAGLTLLRRHPVDLVLTDLVMTGISGVKVLATLHNENPDLPVILVSGAVDMRDSIAALRRGVWDYISKPIDHPLLLHRIEKSLERAALLKENLRLRHNLEFEVEQRTSQLKQRSEELELANLQLHKEILTRQQIEDRLKAANDSWQSTFDSMPDFISIHDQEYTVIKANKALAVFLGKAPEDLLGQKCYQLFHGTFAPWANCPHRELLLTGEPHTCEVIDPHLGKPLMVSVSPIKIEANIIGSIHIARDITQQKRLEEERQKNKNLESISVLCGGLAHDFNNLLTALSGYIDLARMEKSPERVPHWLDNAKMVNTMAAELTKQLLIFSKGGHPVFNSISVPQLIESSLNMQNSNFNQVGSAVRIANDIWEIDGDPAQLRAVIRNIFYNAAEAMPDGGIFTVEARNIPKDNPSPQDQRATRSPLPVDSVLISFSDQGQGIDPENIDKVFDPYFTTSAKGAIKGKGLGLALCHSIISKHHGVISIASKKDLGTTVSIYLPASSNASQL